MHKTVRVRVVVVGGGGADTVYFDKLSLFINICISN